MKRVSKAAALVIVLATVGFVTQWVGATGVEDRVYEWNTIPTSTNAGDDYGFGEFEAGGLFLVTIDPDPTPLVDFDNSPPCVSTVYDGHWRQRQFRRLTLFKSVFSDDTFTYDVTGMMPRAGEMAGTAVYFDDGELRLARWKALETDTCDLTQAP